MIDCGLGFTQLLIYAPLERTPKKFVKLFAVCKQVQSQFLSAEMKIMGIVDKIQKLRGDQLKNILGQQICITV